MRVAGRAGIAPEPVGRAGEAVADMRGDEPRRGLTLDQVRHRHGQARLAIGRDGDGGDRGIRLDVDRPRVGLAVLGGRRAAVERVTDRRPARPAELQVDRPVQVARRRRTEVAGENVVPGGRRVEDVVADGAVVHRVPALDEGGELDSPALAAEQPLPGVELHPADLHRRAVGHRHAQPSIELRVREPHLVPRPRGGPLLDRRQGDISPALREVFDPSIFAPTIARSLPGPVRSGRDRRRGRPARPHRGA